MKNDSILEALNWRYATKKFDKTKKLTDELVETLIESIRLTATSYGLQAMKVVLVEDNTLREKLLGYSFGQQQVVEASHFLVLCREAELNLSHIESYMQDISNTRGTDLASLDGFKNMITNTVLTKGNDFQEIWMEKQIYIALGNLLTVCANLGIDACPMEGFLRNEYDEVLGLNAKGLAAVLAIPIGYRSKDDKNATLAKVRRSTEKFVVKI